MKLGPLTKLDKKNHECRIKLTMTSCQRIVTSLSFSNLWPIWRNGEAGFQSHDLNFGHGLVTWSIPVTPGRGGNYLMQNEPIKSPP